MTPGGFPHSEICGSKGVCPSPQLIAACRVLRRREAEVLPYLARGRSAKVIAEALFVSESTIRTPTRRILEKTCLHSKQELIDLVEKY